MLYFIVVSNLLTQISFGHVGQNAGTNLRRINLSWIFNLSTPLSCAKFLNESAENLSKAIASKFEEGGVLTPKGLEHVIQILIMLDPETEKFILGFTDDFKNLLNQLSENARAHIAIQKEVVLTALLAARHDVDRTIVRSWHPTEKPSSFLDGLREQRLKESQMIQNDFQKLPGFSSMSGNVKGTAVFQSLNETLSVIYADTAPLEQFMGADLIYYNETYKSFIFMQYKSLDNDNRYRPDEQLNIEIQRMESLLTQAGPAQTNCCADFRIHNNPFFLKLCPRINFEPDSSSFTKGMYIPLTYWRILESSGQLNGPRGGKNINFDNVGRYFTNTDFAVLVIKAWVGSDFTQSSIIAPMIAETLRAGRAALYAIKRPTHPIRQNASQ